MKTLDQCLLVDLDTQTLNFVLSISTADASKVEEFFNSLKEDSTVNFMIKIIQARTKSLNIRLTTEALLYALLGLGVTNPARSSLFTHTLYVLGKNRISDSKEFLVDLHYLISIFNYKAVASISWDQLWAEQKAEDGNGVEYNMVDDYSGVYYQC
jgi:hypothetical protein